MLSLVQVVFVVMFEVTYTFGNAIAEPQMITANTNSIIFLSKFLLFIKEIIFAKCSGAPMRKKENEGYGILMKLLPTY